MRHNLCRFLEFMEYLLQLFIPVLSWWVLPSLKVLLLKGLVINLSLSLLSLFFVLTLTNFVTTLLQTKARDASKPVRRNVGFEVNDANLLEIYCHCSSYFMYTRHDMLGCSSI